MVEAWELFFSLHDAEEKNTDDDAFGTDEKKKVGDSWKINAKALAESAGNDKVKIDPKNAWYYYGLGRTFVANSNWAKAKKFMDKAISLDRTSVQYNAYSGLVLAKIDTLKYGEISLERLRFAIEQEPDNPDYHYWQAQVFEALDRHNQAHLAFKRAAAHDVWTLNYKLGQARNLRLAGARDPEKIEAAIAVIEEGVRRDASGRRDNIN